MKDTLTTFYNQHYLPFTQNDPIDYAGLNTVLDYLKEDVITMYENNIQLHYVEYVERYVNVVWKKKFIVSKIRKQNITKKEKDAKINKLCNQLRKIKNGHIAIMEGTKKISFGKKGKLNVVIMVHDPRFYGALAFGGSIGASEAFMQKFWSVSDLTKLIRIMAINQDAMDQLEGLFNIFASRGVSNLESIMIRQG